MEQIKKRGKPEMRLEPGLVGQAPEDRAPGSEGGGSAGVSALNGPLTVDEVLEYIGFGKFQCMISFIAGLARVADAMEIIIMTILSQQLRCEWRLEGHEVALTSSVVFLAIAIGSLIWGIVCDKYGRRIGLTISMCVSLYFGFLSTFAPGYSWLLFLRFLVGIGIGGSPQALTLYSEFLPVTLRGRCLTLLTLFWVFGSIFEILLVLLIMPTLGWRWLLGLSVIPMGIFLIVNNWLPESPRLDMLSGRTAKALETLRYVAKQNRKRMPDVPIVAVKEDNRGQIKDLFTPQIRHTTLLLNFLWFSSTFCYYGMLLLTPGLLQTGNSCGRLHNVLLTSSAEDVEAETGLTCALQCKYLTSDDYRHILWMLLAEILGPILLLFVLDRIGRKKSMVLAFLMFSLFLLPLFTCLGSTSVTSLILVSRAFISASFQVCYIYTPEVFPTQTRALGIGFCIAIGKMGSLVSPFVSEVMSGVSLHSSLSVFCAMSLLAAFASVMLPIETLGKQLRDTNHDQDAEMTPTTLD